MTDERLLDTLKRLSQALGPGDLDQTLANITAAAVSELPGVHYASITIRHDDGRLDTAAPTDDMLLGLDAAQYDLQEGPCYDAAVDQPFVVARNLAADERFPRYGELAVRTGIRAQAGLRLFETPGRSSQGALNLYSRDVGAFEDIQIVGQLFAHQAAVALDYAREIDNLNEAMRTRQLIGRAVGIVMERYGMPEERAFAFLARISQTRNVKLRLVADELVAATESQAES